MQDDWRATGWLTINLGVRYDVYPPYTEENNQMSNMDPFTGTLYVAGQNGASETAGVKTDYSNVQPRIGFAATLPYSTVVRGGFGLSFVPSNQTSFSVMKNEPLFSLYGPVTSLGDALGGVPDLLLRQGLPEMQKPNISAARDLAGTFRAVDVNLKSTRYQQFNLNVEKEFAGNVATIGYVGNIGDFVSSGNNQNLNLAPIGPGAVQARRIFGPTLPRLNTINYYTTRHESSYHALQLIFQRRFRDGLALTTHYTRSVAKSSGPQAWAVVDPVTFEFTEEWSVLGQRCATCMGRADQLRAAVRSEPDGRQVAARRLAGERLHLLAVGPSMERVEFHRAREHERWRSAEHGGRSNPPEGRADRAAVVQYRSVRSTAAVHARQCASHRRLGPVSTPA